MGTEIKCENIFPEIFNNTKAKKSDINALLIEIGNANCGKLLPTKNEYSEKYLIKRIDDALNRQVTFYLNQLTNNEDWLFLDKKIIKDISDKSPWLLFDSQSKNINLKNLHNKIGELEKQPTFKNYIDLFISNQISFSAYALNQDILENELLSILLRLKSIKPNPLLPFARTQFREEKINSLKEAVGKSFSKFESNQNDYVVALFDIYYFEVLIEQLTKAKKSIDILMFYFSLDRRRKDAITTKLFDAIIEAHKRKVQINIVLDKDKQGQKYFSRKINNNAIQNLQEAGINARFDSIGKVTHSKIIVIDSKVTFIGSHNFSLSSAHIYDEASVMISSEKLATFYKEFISNN